MSNINKAAVLNPFNELTANILDYVPRATTSEFGIVAIGSGINVDHLGRIYLDTQEYSDRLTAIEAQAASTLATQKSEVAAAIAQVNLTQSQTITALTLEVSNLKTNLTDSITATQTELINRADQLAQNVTDITDQLALDKAVFTQEIQDALDYLKDDASVASALRTPRKINGTDFDGRNDITTDTWGATRTFQIGNKTNSINGASNVAYSLADIGAFPQVGGTIQGNVEVTGNLSVAGTISATLEGTAASADKLQTPRTINGVSFDGTANITIADSTKVPLSGGTMTGNLNANALGVSNNSNTSGLGISLYSGANAGMPSYGLAFSGTATFGGHGDVDGDWATYFTMSGATNQGWIFKSGNGAGGNVASISANGVITGNQFKFTENWGTNYISNGNEDAASYSSHNMIIRSWWGIGFRDHRDVCRTVLDTRTGNFSTQGTVVASGGFAGNASTATRLQTARAINGVAFDGTANITIPTMGTGQAWLTVTASRAVNTTYTNTTGKPIIVNIFWRYEEGNPNWGYLTVDGYSVGSGRGEPNEGITAVIPHGSTYRYESAGWGFSMWREYR